MESKTEPVNFLGRTRAEQNRLELEQIQNGSLWGGDMTDVWTYKPYEEWFIDRL